MEAWWPDSPLASLLTSFPDIPLSFVCLQILSPSSPKLPSSKLFLTSVHHDAISPKPRPPLKSPFPQAGQGRGRILTVSLGLRWEQVLDRQTRLKCGCWSCVGRPVFSPPSPTDPTSPPAPPLHRHPVGQGARSGQRRPLCWNKLPCVFFSSLGHVSPTAGPQQAGPRSKGRGMVAGKGPGKDTESPSLPTVPSCRQLGREGEEPTEGVSVRGPLSE